MTNTICNHIKFKEGQHFGYEKNTTTTQNYPSPRTKRQNPSLQIVIQSKITQSKANQRQDSHTGYM